MSTLKQIADELGICHTSLYYHRSSGMFPTPVNVIGNRQYFDAEEVKTAWNSYITTKSKSKTKELLDRIKELEEQLSTVKGEAK